MATLEEMNKALGVQQNTSLLSDTKKEDRFDFNTGTLIQTPVNTPNDLFQNEARVKNGERPDEIFGNGKGLTETEAFKWIQESAPVQAIRGVGAAAVSIPIATAGSQFIQFGEGISEDRVGLFEIRGFDTLKQYWFDNNIFTGGIAGIVPDTVREFLQKRGVGQRHIDAGRRLMESNTRILAETGLGLSEGEDPSFAYKLGQGGTSLIGAVGLTVMFKSPSVAAGVFGTVQQSQTYLDARAAGKTPQESFGLATGTGAFTAITEAIGIGQLFKIAKSSGVTKELYKKVLKAAVAGAGVEGTQEGIQFIGVSTIEELSGITDREFTELFDEFIDNVLIGGLLGFGAGGTLSAHNSRVKRLITESPEFQDMLIDSVMGDTLKAIEADNDLMGDTLSSHPATDIAKGTKENIEIWKKQFDAAIKGANLDDVFISEKKREQLVQDAMSKVVTNQQAKTREAIKSGRVRVLQTQQQELLETLERLEVEGAEFTEGFLEGEGVRETQDSLLTRPKGKSETPESKREFQRIERESLQAEQQLESVVSQLAEISSIDPEAIKGDILTTASKVKQADRDVLLAFKAGVRVSKKATIEQKKQVQETLLKVINDLKLDDKIASKLKNRIPGLDTTAQLVKEIDSVLSRAKAATVRLTRVDLRADLKKLISKAKSIVKGGKLSGKFQEDVSTMVDRISKLEGKNQTVTDNNISHRRAQMNRDLEAGEIQTELDELESRYLDILAKAGKVPVPELLDFIDDFQGTLKEGKEFVIARDRERKEQIKKSKQKLKGDIESTKEFIIDKGRLTMTVKDMVNHLGETWNTWVEGINGTKIAELLRFNKSDVDFAQAIAEISNEFSEFIENTVGVTLERLKTYNDKGFFKSSYELRGNHVPIDMTRGEVVQRIMELKNPGVLESVMDPKGSMGYPQELIDSMESSLDAVDIKIMDKFFEMYERSYNRINAVYRRIYNVDLPKVEFYTSISREFVAEGQETSFFEDMIDNGNKAVSLSALKGRTKSTAKLKDRNVLDVATKYFNDSEYWIAYAEAVRDAHEILVDEDIKEAIIDKRGEGAYRRGLDHLSSFARQRSSRSAGDLVAFDWVRKNFMASVLGLKPQIGFKQLSSTLAFAEEVPAVHFAKGLAKYMANPGQANRILGEHATFKYRGKNFDNELNRVTDKKTLSFYGEKNKIQDFFMLPIKYGDSVAVKSGAFAMYDYLTTVKGVSKQDALNQVATMTERTQQSTKKSNLTLLQKSDNSLIRLVTMFTSSPIALINAQMSAYSRFRNGDISARKFMRTMFIYQVAIQGVFGFVASGFREDDDEILKNTLIGPWSGLPMVGSGLEFMATVMANTLTDGDVRKFQNAGIVVPVTEGLVDIGKLGESMAEAFKDMAKGNDVEYVEFMEAFIDVAELGFRAPFKTSINIFGGIGDVIDGDVHEGTLRIAGFPESIAEESSKD